MTKLEKIDKELKKARSRLLEWQTKVKELEAKRIEEENTQIVGIVRSLNMSPEELATFLKRSDKISGLSKIKREESDHEK
jgi:hypothetical protein